MLETSPGRCSRAGVGCRGAAAGFSAAVLLCVTLTAYGARGPSSIRVYDPDHRRADRITPILLDGAPYVSTNDLARVFNATKFWRAELQKLSIRIENHTVRVTVDAAVILVDESAKNVTLPARLVRGVVYVPEYVLGRLFDWGVITDASYDPEARIIRFRGTVHSVRQAQLFARNSITEVSATLQRGLAPRVLYAIPGEIRILLEGGTLDTTRTFSGGLITEGWIREDPAGVELRLRLSDDARGYSVSVGASRFKISITDNRGLVDAGLFSALEPVWLGGANHEVRVIVIDPGHGGGDHGAALRGGVAEKDAALEIARALKTALASRLRARIILTREGDVELSAERRAEIANGNHADLFLSVHVDPEGLVRGGGFRVHTLPPTALAREDAPAPIAIEDEGGVVQLRPWGAAPSDVVAASSALGQSIIDGLRRTFPQSPARLYAGRIPILKPVFCPAVLLESSPASRSGPEAGSLRGFTVYGYVEAVAIAVEEFIRRARA